ncbi:ribonuclease domain-containing protein [Streptomyces sp. NPDC058001]|uniref:ribonuclease domain-containing protein n=1 Tax=Streptomyces sp. NPDC058001 TaxID=3346300 RepID=UPI0036E4397F
MPLTPVRRALTAPLVRRPLLLIPLGPLVALVALIGLLGSLAGCAGTDSGTSTRPTVATAVTTPGWAHGMVTVTAERLPAEARDTLRLIDQGGPFPYTRDGVVFGNFERLLPQHQRGYYHEYTVPTPGSRDRGARRLVSGDGGEIYYTDDHYASFKAVLR